MIRIKKEKKDKNMKFCAIRKQVYNANLELVNKDLVISTWGNVSGYDPENDVIAIKPSGIPYKQMKVEDIVILDLEGNIVDGKCKPSTDTPTHLELYRKFIPLGIYGIVHTHSKYATSWAQSGREIPCYGTTHVDYFYGNIPITRQLSSKEMENYEINTGKIILEKFTDKEMLEIPAVLVRNHGPFAWGKTPEDAVTHSQVLEFISEMAIHTEDISESPTVLPRKIADKHHLRKFGKDAYYGQE